MLSPVKIWRNQKKIAGLIGRTGTIVSWTVVRVPPARFSNQAPYPVVLVQLDSGERLMAQMVDPPVGEAGWQPKELAFGQRVVTLLRRAVEPTTEGIIPYGIKVKPL